MNETQNLLNEIRNEIAAMEIVHGEPVCGVERVFVVEDLNLETLRFEEEGDIDSPLMVMWEGEWIFVNP